MVEEREIECVGQASLEISHRLVLVTEGLTNHNEDKERG